MTQLEKIRQEFPALGEQVYGKPLVYLDNAATSQRPLSVIRKWEEVTEKYNANLHRAVHRLADLATQEYEATRDAVLAYLNAESRQEVVFTAGATAADIALMRQTVGPDMGVKAAGGIRDLAAAFDMIRAGATRIGTSAGVKIVDELRAMGR